MMNVDRKKKKSYYDCGKDKIALSEKASLMIKKNNDSKWRVIV